MDTVTMEIYGDYACPYVYNAAVWLDRVKREYGDGLQITWKSFSLEQVTNRECPDYKVWEQEDIAAPRSLLSLVVGEAARGQDAAAFERFHLALLIARHGGSWRIALNDLGAILDIAGEVGLDIESLKQAVEDPATVAQVGRDHTEAVEQHGVFGTPTFVFEVGGAAYLKTFIPPEAESLAFFENFAGMTASSAYFGELKRPQPPWPKGAI